MAFANAGASRMYYKVGHPHLTLRNLPVFRNRALPLLASYCASCHGDKGKGSDKVGSIVDPRYLTLISDQGLRTITIIGRPDFNAPDWRNNVPGHPMSDQEITDVVAWLSSQRPAGVTTASTPATASSPGGQQ